MDKDRDESRRKEVAGSVKELIGKLIGNKDIENEGAREKAGWAGIRGIGVSKAPEPNTPD